MRNGGADNPMLTVRSILYRLHRRWHRQDGEVWRKQHDAVTYATKALESTLKIISDESGWSTGNERGAVNYIENLQSSGRFIAAWEARR
jgi:hypothetical protein